MTNDILTNISCPNCLNPIDIREHGRHITCDACSSQFILRGHLCPNCSSYNDDETAICGQCATALTRICRKCKTSNWAGDEYCQECKNALDILDLIVGNYQSTTSDRLLEQRLQAKQLQAEEEQASIRRMGELLEIEAERQEEIQRRMKIQKEHEKTTYILLGLVLGLVLLALFIYSIFSLL